MKTDMTDYKKCNMTLPQHLAAYLVCSLLGACIAYLFYHLLILSALIGLVIGVLLERMYAQSVTQKRQKALLVQFRDFLEAMEVAVRAGSVEIEAIRSARKDLASSYSEKSDILIEIDHMLLQYEKGGIGLKELFEDLAVRSGLDDIESFAEIYSVIAGKSSRFGEVLSETLGIIRDKIEIQQEIETTITSAKSETNMMLVMPIIIVGVMSAAGGDLMESLFTTSTGHLAATAALAIFVVSYVLAIKMSDIEV